MDIVLVVITAVSLSAALIMSLVAMKAAQAERTRTAARVAALRMAAEAEPVPARENVVEPATPVAEPIAVGESRGPAPWPPARVASFAAQGRAIPAAPVRTVAIEEGSSTTALGDSFLGSTASPSGSAGRQRSLAAVAVLLFVAALSGGYWAVFADRAPAPAGTATTSGAALELVSLRHERRGAKLDVTGLVRNPTGGGTLEKLTAVVFLFDRQGGFLSSARANVDYLSLVPGDESPFVISLDAPASVARYRVSFRNDAGVVPHIDRRGQEPLAEHAVTPSPAAAR